MNDHLTCSFSYSHFTQTPNIFLDSTLGGFGHFSPRDRDQSLGRSVSRSPEWPKTAADWKGLHNLPGAPYKSQIRR